MICAAFILIFLLLDDRHDEIESKMIFIQEPPDFRGVLCNRLEGIFVSTLVCVLRDRTGIFLRHYSRLTVSLSWHLH